MSLPCMRMHAGAAAYFSWAPSAFHLVTARCEAGADLCVVIEWRREGNESRWGPEGEKGTNTV